MVRKSNDPQVGSSSYFLHLLPVASQKLMQILKILILVDSNLRSSHAIEEVRIDTNVNIWPGAEDGGFAPSQGLMLNNGL